MATTVEVIFVGLCTFVNVTNQNSSQDVPAASAVVMKHSGHQSFIAFDAGAVDVTGVTPTPISTSRFSMIEFLPEGETLTFNDDRTQLPTVDASFDSIANFAEYSGFSSNMLKAWNPDYIPVRNGLPKPDRVAAYVEFGAGRITADRMTLRKYQFTIPTVTPDKDKAKCYAREVHYAYETSGKGLLIEARSLKTNTKRAILFTPKGGATGVQIWIGTSTRPLADIRRDEPSKFLDGDHFSEFYQSDRNADDAAHEPLPRPVPYDCKGNPALLEATAQVSIGTNQPKNARQQIVTGVCRDCGQGDPSIGYCGPESKP